MAKIPLTAVILTLSVLSLLSPTTAEIKTLTITADTRPMILFEKFGFTHSGHVTFTVSEVSVTSSLASLDPSRLGFFLLSGESLLQALIELQQNPTFCVLDSHYILKLFTFRGRSPPPNSCVNKSYTVTSRNEYGLFFANCAPESSVSMRIHTEVFNVDAGGFKDLLSAVKRNKWKELCLLLLWKE